MKNILITTTFCTSRDKARELAKSLNGKFVDNGKDAPKGSRWEVQYHVVDVKLGCTDVQPDDVKGFPVVKSNTLLKLARTPKGSNTVHCYVHNNNKAKTKVPVYKKRSYQSQI